MFEIFVFAEFNRFTELSNNEISIISTPVLHKSLNYILSKVFVTHQEKAILIITNNTWSVVCTFSFVEFSKFNGKMQIDQCLEN